MKKTVMSYDDGRVLDGTPTAELARESESEPSGTGAVPAYCDADGVWCYVPPSQVDYVRKFDREDVITVYVID